MKRKLLIAVSLGLAIAACQKEKSVSTSQQTSKPNLHSAARFKSDSTDTVGSQFISVNIANAMISSYLYSINSTENDSDIKSFSVNADSLRAYLADNSITNVKLMIAHTMDYINAGYNGVYAGYQSGALTIIIAGYDINGNYVYYQGSEVLDHLTPCPYNCYSGAAGNALLQ